VASVEFRPGDTLNIVWTLVHETPFGTKEVESTYALSYEELLQRMGATTKGRKPSGKGGHFSRVVSLSAHALRKGTWTSGAAIDRSDVFLALVEHFHTLQSEDYGKISKAARRSLLALYEGAELLEGLQKVELEKILVTLGLLPSRVLQ